MRDIFKFDWILVFVVALLLGLSSIILYSLSFAQSDSGLSYFIRHLFTVAIGIGAIIFLAFYDYRALNTYSTKLYFAILIILSAVLIWGTQVRGTTGWLGLGNFHIQPVEVAKVIMIIFLASFLSKKKTKLSIPSRIIASIVLVLLPVLLIWKQPDFGSSMIIIAIWLGMILFSGVNKKSLVIIFLVGVMALASGYFLIKDYQKERLANFFNVYRDPQGSGYNVIQSMVAVGSGGVFGKGLGHGSQSQLNFLPEKHTDFIFAVIAEELGLFGSLIALVLFSVVLFRIKETARLARDNFGYLLCIGIMAMLFSQILINIGMNVGLVPVAGVPLPFLSYGGSSMVSVLAAMGILQSVYTRRIKTLD